MNEQKHPHSHDLCAFGNPCSTKCFWFAPDERQWLHRWNQDTLEEMGVTLPEVSYLEMPTFALARAIDKRHPVIRTFNADLMNKTHGWGYHPEDRENY